MSSINDFMIIPVVDMIVVSFILFNYINIEDIGASK